MRSPEHAPFARDFSDEGLGHAANRWCVSEPADVTGKLAELLGEYRRFAFEQQDESMIRAQLQNMQTFPPERLKPVMLETDVGIVRWHRIMDKLLAADAG